jgi:hypothetical protein
MFQNHPKATVEQKGKFSFQLLPALANVNSLHFFNDGYVPTTSPAKDFLQ